MSTTATSASTHAPELNNGVLTSWLPLTTAYPSSAGCENSMWRVVTDTIAAWDPGYGIYVQPGFDCLPPQVTSWWDANHLSTSIDLSATQFSIGPIVCPEAYTTATTITNALSSTFVACCPSNYQYLSSVGVGSTGECASKLEEGQVVSFASYNYNVSQYQTYTMTMNASSSAWGIPVNGWLFPGGTTSTTSSSSSTTSSDSSSSSTSTPGNESTGLSTGAKAGIGVGVGIAVLAAIAIAAALIFRRRKRSAATPNSYYSSPGQQQYHDPRHAEQQTQLFAPEMGATSPKPYTDYYGGRQEMYAMPPQAHTPVHELPEHARSASELPVH